MIDIKKCHIEDCGTGFNLGEGAKVNVSDTKIINTNTAIKATVKTELNLDRVTIKGCENGIVVDEDKFVMSLLELGLNKTDLIKLFKEIEETELKEDKESIFKNSEAFDMLSKVATIDWFIDKASSIYTILINSIS